MTDILKIFYILVAIKLCQSFDGYLINDQCIKHLPENCPENRKNWNQTNMQLNNNAVITDKYNFTLYNMSLFWKIDFMDLSSKIKLSTSRNNINNELDKLFIFCSSMELHQFQNVFDNKQAKYKSNAQIIRINNQTLELTLNICSRNINSSLWHDFIWQSTEKYSKIKFIGHSERPTFIMNDNLFSNQIQLETLVFRDLRLENLNAAVFQNLTKLKILNIYQTDIIEYSYNSFSTLRHNLVNIRMHEHWMESLKIFENFEKLETITLITTHQPDFIRNSEMDGLKAIVCMENIYKPNQNCIFIRGINNQTCPNKCNCYVKYASKSLVINCTKKGFDKIAKLPIPITGSVSLYYDKNKVSKLPNRTSIDYANVQELHLSNNKINKLNIDQLPLQLTHLDIRNNSINSIDNEVAEYLWNRRDQLTFLQSGILWKSNCENNAFVKYLGHLQNKAIPIDFHFSSPFYTPIPIVAYQLEPVHFYELNGPCPKNCLCCLNETNKHFTIDCRNLYLNHFPDILNNINADLAILLDNNSLEILPNIRYSEIRELHLSNNRIQKFWRNQIPLNLKVLDLRNNNLDYLDNDVMTILEKKEIKLSGNPLQCSCKFDKLLHYLKNNEASDYKSVLKRCSGSDYCPETCFCCMEEETNLYKIDCNNRKFQVIPKLPEVHNIKLLFEKNHITYVNDSTLGFNNIKELYLKFNKIQEIVNIPHLLTHLDIRNNSLTKLSDSVLNSLARSMPSVYMSGNRWICECYELPFIRYTKEYANNITDLCRTGCSNSKMLVKIEEKDVCSDGLPLFVLIFIILMVFGAFLNWLQYFWKSISMWLYENNVLANIIGLRKTDNEKKYDCFLAYCHKDSDFLQEFIDILENEPSNLRLCYYARDWLPGEPIPACICKSVEESKRIIILMTNNFLKSVWGRLEFRKALHATAKDKCKRLIVVVYSDVKNFDDLDSELKAYMKLNTYLKRDDPNFWDKLIISMPKKELKSTDSDEVEIELSNL